jgi:hypothetical protein
MINTSRIGFLQRRIAQSIDDPTNIIMKMMVIRASNDVLWSGDLEEIEVMCGELLNGGFITAKTKDQILNDQTKRKMSRSLCQHS